MSMRAAWRFTLLLLCTTTAAQAVEGEASVVNGSEKVQVIEENKGSSWSTDKPLFCHTSCQNDCLSLNGNLTFECGVCAEDMPCNPKADGFDSWQERRKLMEKEL